MAEFARWQWDDIGQWRDFAEQYQAEMEAAFQKRENGLELTIPPFGTFRMDLKNMQQVTVKGRNPGYSRQIRRQARKIEAGYFILGHEGDICTSDEAIDQIGDIPALEALVKLLGRIVGDPEDFGGRSANLGEEEWSGSLGACDAAVEFLTERGFEEIEEGKSRFVVYMQEDISGLAEALREVHARLERVRKSAASSATHSESNVVTNDTSNAVSNAESNGVGNDVGCDVSNNESNDTSKIVSNEVGKDVSNGVSHDVARHASNNVCEDSNDVANNEVGETGESFCIKGESSAKFCPPARLVSVGDERDGSGSLMVNLVLPAGEVRSTQLVSATLDALLSAAVKSTGFRLPAVRRESGDKSVGLSCEPGMTLRFAAGERIVVEDFEGVFVERLSQGLLRLRDLASVAPLLAWHRPELPKLVTGRLRSLVEGSCEAWCKAAECCVDDELLHGRALLRFLYADKPLDERIAICRQLLPTEKKDTSLLVKVKRSNFLQSAVECLDSRSAEHFRRPVSVEFVGEVAEDHGGPRRDFFGSFGARLVHELPALWKRLPRGAIVPVADVVARETPKSDRCGLDDVDRVYRACGRVCGLATKTGDVICEEMAVFFLHQVARDDVVSLDELQRQLREADGEGDIRSSKAILEKKLPELGLHGLSLTRVITHTETTVDLVPGGRDIPVTEDNKAEWLELHLHNKLYGSLQKAADAFRSGLLDVLGGTRRTCPFLVLLSPAELSCMWRGMAVTDEHVRRWREVAVVSAEVERQAAWLWELLEQGDEGFRTNVLRFSTGAHRIGQGGLQQFEIQPADGGDGSLPKAMTCANMLQLPRYTSRAVLEAQLRKAIEFCDGFQSL